MGGCQTGGRPLWRVSLTCFFFSFPRPQLVNCAADILASRPSTRTNVLVNAVRRARAAGAPGGVDVVTPAWAALASRIGDGLTLHLLTQAAIFVPLPRGCWAQVVGPPPGALVKDVGVGGGRTRRGRRGGRGRASARAAVPPAPVSQPASPERGGGAVDVDRGAMDVDGSGAACPEPSSARWPPAGVPTSAPSTSARPSSWRRRKAAAARVAAENTEIVTPPSTAAVGAPSRGGSPPPPPERRLPPPDAAPAPAPARPPPPSRATLRRAARTRAAARAAARDPLATDMDRPGLLHCRPFGGVPGLPRGHPLRAAAASTHPGRRLYSLIFGTAARRAAKADAAASCGRWREAATAATARRRVPSPERRVPARARALPPLLAVAAVKAHRCQYGALLDAHCPLPPDAAAARRARQAAKAARAAGAPPPPRPPPPPTLPPPIPHAAVASFAWAVLRSIVPPPLLTVPGRPARASLRAAVGRVVGARRHEKVASLVAAGWCAPPPPAFRPPPGSPASAAAAAARTAAIWRRWLLGGVVVPLLRACFYVTESGGRGGALSYHRKPAWAAAAGAVVEAALADRYVPIGSTADDGSVVVLSARGVGPGAPRVVPKPGGGARVVVNMARPAIVKLDHTAPSAPARAPAGGVAKRRGVRTRSKRRGHALATTTRFCPPNVALAPALRALSAAARAAPHALGASSLSVGAACAALAPALAAWRTARRAHARACSLCTPSTPCPSAPLPCLVTADAAAAFDRLRPPAVAAAAAAVLVAAGRPAAETVVSHVATPTRPPLPPRRGSNGASAPPPGTLRAVIRRIEDTVARPAGVAAAAGARAAPLATRAAAAAAAGPRGRVFADAPPPAGRHGSAVAPAAAAAAVTAAATSASVAWQGRVYSATRGVPQGGRASTLLACAALAEFERRHLVPVLPAPAGARPVCGVGSGCACARPSAAGLPTTLVRLVDDFLIITPCPAAAADAAAALAAGSAAVGVASNHGKACGWGGDAPLPGVPPPTPHASAPGPGLVPWCGLALDAVTLEVGPAPAPVRIAAARSAAADAVTLPPSGAPAARLVARAVAVVRARLAPSLLLDPRVASRVRAARSVRAAVRAATLRADAHWRALPPSSRPPPRVLTAAVLACGAAAARLAAARAAAAGGRPLLSGADAAALAAATGLDALASRGRAKRAVAELRHVLAGRRTAGERRAARLVRQSEG